MPDIFNRENINMRIGQLADYAVKTGLADENDRCYLINAICETLCIREYDDVKYRHECPL